MFKKLTVVLSTILFLSNCGGGDENSGEDALLSGVTIIDAGFNYSCANVNNTIKCWGDLTWSNNISFSPIDFRNPDVLDFKIPASTTNCVLLTDRTVKCWGYNTTGQLGNGTITDSTTPVLVSNLDRSSISTGTFFWVISALY